MLLQFSEEVGLARAVAQLVGRVLTKKNPKTAPTPLGGAALRRWRQEDQNFQVNPYYVASSRVTQLNETLSQKRVGGSRGRKGKGREKRKARQDSPCNTDSEGERSVPCVCGREKD